MQSCSKPSQLRGSSSTIFDMTGGSSAVLIRDMIGCSIDSSPSVLVVVKLEFDLRRCAVCESVRCLARGAAAATLRARAAVYMFITIWLRICRLGDAPLWACAAYYS